MKRNWCFRNADFKQDYLTFLNVIGVEENGPFVTSGQDTDTTKLGLKGSIFQLFMNQIILTSKNVGFGPVYNFSHSVMCCCVAWFVCGRNQLECSYCSKAVCRSY